MEMESGTSWKKRICDQHTISYEKSLPEYTIILEARKYMHGWEIIKKYVGREINFAETYSVKTISELKNLLKHLRAEKDLSKSEIQDIIRFKKKPIRIQLKRAYKTDEAEKWYFGINNNQSNFLVLYEGHKEIVLDIVMEHSLKYIEEKVVDKILESLGVEKDLPIQQNIYYYNKKSSYLVDVVEDDIDVEFIFE